MSQNYNYFFIFAASFLLSVLLTLLYIFLAKKFNFVDDPTGNPRKIHRQPVPLGGGLAIFVSLLLVMVFLFQRGWLIDAKIEPRVIVALFFSGVILFGSGYLDDRLSLKPWQSLVGPILAIVLIILSGLQIVYVTNPAGGILVIEHIWLGYFSLLLTFFWLLGMTYTTKLLDGIDGLAASVCLIASLMIFVVSLTWDIDYSPTSLISLALAGALLGFLVWNWHPAKVFLGEGGSTFLGFAVGVLAIISGSKIATALLVMGAPIIDVLVVMWRRFSQKKSIWQGDNEHLHFKLRQLGLSHPQIALFLSLLSLVFGLMAVFFSTKIKILLLFIFVAGLLSFHYWLNHNLSKKNV